MTHSKRFTATVLLLLSLFASVAIAADLNQAKQKGLIGERADGYLGMVVSSAPADVVAMVADVNKKRKARYEKIAKANGITIKQVQALAGKKAIERTRGGDWILVNGGWRKK